MNCMRCLESIMKLDKAYRKYGLNAVLVHPSEWEFEKSKENIAMAAKDLGISLPIIVDRDRRIIKGMGVNFWPAQILFHDGKAIYRHIGEGEYKKLEDKIQEIYGAKNKAVFSKEPIITRYPALYFGRRKGNFKFTYAGEWKQGKEYSEGKGVVIFPVKGRKVYVVAEATRKTRILVNKRQKIDISYPGLYLIASFKRDIEREISIISNSKIRLYSAASL